MTDTTDKTTPRPWQWMSCGFAADPVIAINGKGDSAAVIHKGHRGDKPVNHQIADAELIVRAVNRDHLFDELVGALEQARPLLAYLTSACEPVPEMDAVFGPKMPEIYEAITTALARVQQAREGV